ncbi:MAG: YidB family protein [Pseudomonadota bacterium]
MDLLKLGTDLLMSKLGGANASADGVQSVLAGLIGDGDQMDIAGLIGQLQGQGGGITELLGSWLGDGTNAPVSADQVRDMLGGDKVAAAAQQLGTDEGSLLSGLQDALPEMVNQASSGGSLLDAVGGLGGLGDMAKKFL